MAPKTLVIGISAPSNPHTTRALVPLIARKFGTCNMLGGGEEHAECFVRIEKRVFRAAVRRGLSPASKETENKVPAHCLGDTQQVLKFKLHNMVVGWDRCVCNCIVS